MPKDDGQALKLEPMRMNLNLNTKQAVQETPPNIAIFPATVAAIAGASGYKFEQQPVQAPVIAYGPTPTAAK